ncbi:MAG: MFS transporter [Deltaproteobacteria bacterium]|nr:MFS transporter [Deltaproteobacteria bacterium]MBW2359357.1 MFS transporter [Deltaproteobacteria bacterium]
MNGTNSKPQEADQATLALSRVLVYSSPLLMVHFVSSLSHTYFVKYGTDTLMVAPAMMTSIFGLSRLWEALCDPIVGFSSDRTRHRLGRRRSWLVFAVFPLVIFAFMMWCAPVSLGGNALLLWLAAASFGFATATSSFAIPHAALGAEMSLESKDRTRLFGTNGLMGALASALALTVGMGSLRTSDDPRATAALLIGGVGLLGLMLAIWMIRNSSEPERHQGRGGKNPYAAFSDVFRNPHARILIAVGIFVHMTWGAMGTVAVYMLQYVMKMPGSTELFMMSYFIPNLASVPLWIRLSHRYEKRHLWMVCLAGSACFYLAMGLVPEGVDLWVALSLSLAMGFFGGGFHVFEHSIRAEVIDWDEYRTGERKEGVYSAASQLVGKAAGAAVTVAVGFALAWADYLPNVEQTPLVKTVIRVLFSGVPAACFLVALLMLSRFELSRGEHARIRTILDERIAKLRDSS